VLFSTFTGCGGGGDSSSSDSVEAGTPVDSAPQAQFSVSTDIGSFPLSVQFDASASTDTNGTIVQYAWQFGDGTTGNGSSVQHTYNEAGSYTVVLTVTDNSNLSATHSRVIEVKPQYTLSGTVNAADHVVSDSDVNDTNSIPVSNNSFALAQSVATPITVSGYVNIARAGEQGRSWQQGDTNDIYQVSLTEGMTIVLFMAEDPATADLNLYLYDQQTNLVDASLTLGDAVDILTAPRAGTYYVRVEAVQTHRMSTASGYSLTMGKSNPLTTRYPLRLSDPFVPGEVMVRFEKTDTISALRDDVTGISAMGLKTKAGGSGRDRLLSRSGTTDKTEFFTHLAVQAPLSRSLEAGYVDTEITARMETLWMVRALRQQSGIQFAEPNYIRRPLAVPNDPYYSRQWHYPLINLPDAWDITTGKGDVVVAVVDTGVLLDHPDLQGQFVDGYDFITDPDISLDGDGIDDDPDDPGDQDVGGSSFHGTHVTGTIAALSNNDNGGAGIAWNTRIMPLRALGKGGGTVSDILNAVKYAAGLDNNAGMLPSKRADIINLSLGGETRSQIEETLYAQVRDQGVIVVAAAGNDGTSKLFYPAAYEGVVSVSAVTINETLASYSNFGVTIDVAAPGGGSTDENGDGYADGVFSTIGDDSSGSIEMGYAFAMGTSMAAPHVSGVIALMKALYPGLTPDLFDSLLAAGYLTQDIGTAGRDNAYGYGLIDANKAVVMARDGGSSGVFPAILVVSPGSLNFGTTLSHIDVLAKNGGDASLTLTRFDTDVSWLSVTASVVNSETGLGTYTITVNREMIASAGTYTGTVTFVSSANEGTVSVVVQKAFANAATADGGYHYILLLDPETFETAGQVQSAGEEGRYAFEFTGLSHGKTYIVYAGTDPDNDGYICGDGEACGAYLSLDQPVNLDIVDNLYELDFFTDIIATLPASSTRLGAAGLPCRQEVKKVSK
jgi:serine protease